MDTIPLKDIDCDTLYRIIKSRDFDLVNKIIYFPEFTFTDKFELCIELIFIIKREDLLVKYLEIGKLFTPELLKLLIVKENFQLFVLKYPDLNKLSEDDVVNMLLVHRDKLTLEVVHLGIRKYKLTGSKVIFELFRRYLFDFYKMLVDEGTIEPTIDHLEFICHLELRGV
jgi:CRISPR/Cas system CMR-associated protein Cmr3 (group 5 of RAMP superfamily)